MCVCVWGGGGGGDSTTLYKANVFVEDKCIIAGDKRVFCWR